MPFVLEWFRIWGFMLLVGSGAVGVVTGMGLFMEWITRRFDIVGQFVTFFLLVTGFVSALFAWLPR